MIHHSVGNFMLYKFSTKLFPRKCWNRPENRVNYFKTQKSMKKIAFPPSCFGRLILNFKARLMYDTSFCQDFYTLQLLYESFSTKMLNSASESSQLLESTKKKPEKDAFSPSCFGRCSLNFRARLMYDISFRREFYALYLLYETFSIWVRSTQDPLNNYFEGRHKGAETSGEVYPGGFTYLRGLVNNLQSFTPVAGSEIFFGSSHGLSSENGANSFP